MRGVLLPAAYLSFFRRTAQFAARPQGEIARVVSQRNAGVAKRAQTFSVPFGYERYIYEYFIMQCPA